MSIKRILGITAFGVLFIVAVIGVMLLSSYLNRVNGTVHLPDVSTAPAPGDPAGAEPGALNRIEITRDTVQALISTLLRPEKYSREVVIESFWDKGQATYSFDVAVQGEITSIRTQPPVGSEKRIIVTPDYLYIWYADSKEPYIGKWGIAGDGHRTADEYQMLVTYEDILELDKSNIIDARYIDHDGEDCIYILYRSPQFGYSAEYYISNELGLVTSAEEYDEAGMLVYRMTAGECDFGEIDPTEFTLPDGMVLTAG